MCQTSRARAGHACRRLRFRWGPAPCFQWDGKLRACRYASACRIVSNCNRGPAPRLNFPKRGIVRYERMSANRS
ncbi:hypothetical protein CFB89_21455 [Burkholderia sp. AU16741]|nr:hypothetical protein CFB89_21455 [Burkholderia sp. AU16741]